MEEETTLKSEDSILLSVKKQLGLAEDDPSFDLDIMFQINSAITVLTQIGVGSPRGFIVTTKDDTYNDWLGESFEGISLVKMCIYYRVRLGFDPPSSTAVLECMKEMINEHECRLSYQVDPKNTFGEILDPFDF